MVSSFKGVPGTIGLAPGTLIKLPIALNPAPNTAPPNIESATALIPSCHALTPLAIPRLTAPSTASPVGVDKNFVTELTASALASVPRLPNCFAIFVIPLVLAPATSRGIDLPLALCIKLPIVLAPANLTMLPPGIYPTKPAR